MKYKERVKYKWFTPQDEIEEKNKEKEKDEKGIRERGEGRERRKGN